ncbi:hypothetical protein QQ054_38020 [Oscillatoria amoena NRMC-F 0135]|nr:hypothetical protein [Oscillatoria amoena NRMC-F 0135]
MSWFSRRRREEALDCETRAHLELEAEELRTLGLLDQTEHFAARREFGKVAYLKERVRFMWEWTQFEVMLQDTRLARADTRSLGVAG